MRRNRSSRETRQRQRGTQHTPTRPMQKGSRGRPPRGGAPPPSAALQELQARVAIAPLRKIPLAGPDAPLTLRFLDLFYPIGFGQRALILAPPKTGKTTFLKDLSLGLLAGAPQAVLYGLLIDERPEEITDFRRTVKAEMFASSHDRPPEEHLAVATECLERAVTEVLAHRDVVIVLDSLTRLSRAHNVHTTTGRTMSGGLDAAALELPKRLFGAARQVEHGGSLTIIATCLVDTGSRMDEVIAQEFKGTGNMELLLDRQLAERRLFPAINIVASGTRKEAQLLDPLSLKAAHRLRRQIADLPIVEATTAVLPWFEESPSNAALVAALAGG